MIKVDIELYPLIPLSLESMSQWGGGGDGEKKYRKKKKRKKKKEKKKELNANITSLCMVFVARSN